MPLRAALKRTGAVLTTGGLGPTRDDITKKIVAEMFGAPLEFDERIWATLLERFATLQRAAPESNRSQAEVPRGAIILANRWGTAPGIWLEGKPGLVIMLPGVPLEMRRLLEHEVVPRMAARAEGRIIRSLLVRTTGIPESVLAERMGEIERDIAPLTLAYLPGLEGVDLRLTRVDPAARRGCRAPSCRGRSPSGARGRLRLRRGRGRSGGGGPPGGTRTGIAHRHRGVVHRRACR